MRAQAGMPRETQGHATSLPAGMIVRAGRHSAGRTECNAAAPGGGGTVPLSSSAAGTQPITESPTERRLRESQRVEERVRYMYDKEDWARETADVSPRWQPHGGSLHCPLMLLTRWCSVRGERASSISPFGQQ